MHICLLIYFNSSDDNKVLWGSWAVIGTNNSFWFGGDTGYFEGFKQIGRLFWTWSMTPHHVFYFTYFHMFSLITSLSRGL